MDIMNLLPANGTKLDLSAIEDADLNELSQFIDSDEFSNLLQDKLQLNAEQLQKLKSTLSELSDVLEGQTPQMALPLLQAIIADPKKLMDEGAMVLPMAIPEIANLIQDKLMDSQTVPADEIAIDEVELSLLPKAKAETQAQMQSKLPQEQVAMSKAPVEALAKEVEMDFNEAFKVQSKVTQVPIDSNAILNQLRKVVKETPADPKAMAVTYGEQVAQSTATQSTATVRQTAIPQAIHDNSWRDAFAEKVLWMSNQNIHHAKVQINPPELGPLEVMLKMNQQHASLVIHTPNAATKETLEDAMPRLRELFEQQGMSLTDADISDSRQGGTEGSTASEEGETFSPSGTSVSEENAQSQTIRAPRGLVDYFV